MKQIIEEYAHFLIYALMATLLIQTSCYVFSLHQNLFTFKASDFRAERTLSNEDVPVIYASHRYLQLNDDFDPLEGVYALDKKDGRIETIHVENHVDTSKSGMYEVIYKVSNSLGLHQERKVFVWVENYENDD